MSQQEQSNDLVSVEEGQTSQPFYLLTPTTFPPRSGPTYQVLCEPSDLPAVLHDVQRSRIVALDFETKGADYSDDLSIVGIGLAYDSGAVYFDWTSLDSS